MAIPVLDSYHKDGYAEVIAQWKENGECHLSELEQQQFEYDHAAIGALMAEAWKLPQYIVDSIAAHHLSEGKVQAEPAVQLVALMKYFDDNNPCEELIEVAQEKFALEKSTIEEMVTRSFSYAEEFIDTFR